MEPYIHKIQYYETDRMGITHHSNYVRFMEEARVDYFEKIGWGYDLLEKAGIVSPVTAVELKYRLSTSYPETIKITVTPVEYTGVRLKFRYVMQNGAGRTVCEATSEHCFLNSTGRPVRLKTEQPELHALLESLCVPKSE